MSRHLLVIIRLTWGCWLLRAPSTSPFKSSLRVISQTFTLSLPMQIGKWRKSAVEQLPELFADGRTRKGAVLETGNDALYEEIGRLKVELDWLKKKVGMLD